MKPLITVSELRCLMPQLSLGKAGFYTPFLEAAMREQEIISKPRRCAFLSQLAHESAQLRYMEEIASGAAYEGRQDLGNIHPGDGKRFKGRGPIQLTGRANYRNFGRVLGIDLEASPELAAKPEYGFRVAALFWKLKGLNELADRLTLKKNDAGDKLLFAQITKRINGGYNGLPDRFKYFTTAKQVLHNDDEDPSSPSPIAPPTARPAESVHEQESNESVAQAESPAEVSTDPDVDLLGAAVSSDKAKKVGLSLGARVLKHSGAALTWVYAFYEANKIGFIVVILVLIAGAIWLVYHNRKKFAPHILKLLK